MGPKRDYYVDLELPPSADIPEIKKQFRRLALKYHPDRNPGREVEVNSQFQIIQSAHEILSDPQQKAKYDVTYRRSNRFPSASGVKGNPWQNVGQQFPPPPCRNTATSGAQRWSSRFSKGVPPTAKQQTASDSEAKNNAARAFENMRSRTTQQEPRSRPPPPPPPRTESAKQRAQAAFGTRKAGFQPRSSATGDEPPVSSRNYFSRPTAAQPPLPGPLPRNPCPTTAPDPLEQFRTQKSFVDTHTRQSSPYSWKGSEKTDPFDGISQGRSRFTTEPTRHSGPPAASQGLNEEQRHHSASVPKFPLSKADGVHPHHKVRLEDGLETSTTAWMTSSQTSSDPSSHSTDAATEQASVAANRPRFARRSGSAPSIFNIAVVDETLEQTPGFAGANDSRNTGFDDINTRFVHEDIANPWSFSAGSGHTDGPTNKIYRPASGRRTNRHPSPKYPDLRRADDTRQPQAETPSKGFNAGSWKFNPQIFAPQPVPGLSVSPTRSHRANSKRVRVKPTAGTAAVVDESSSDGETYELRRRNTSRTKNAGADSPLAMDIDSPPSGLDEAIPNISSSARNIPVEPSRPEWRPGNVDFVRNESKLPRPDKIPGNHSVAVGSEDSDDLRASFADLEGVPPIAMSKMGLGSLADLKANLPFESKASEDVAIDQPPTVHRLTLPPFPEAPRLPHTVAIEGIKPNAASWTKYLAEFENYLRQWDRVNDQVVDHFATRKTHIAGIRQPKGSTSPRAIGDCDIREYLNWVQQDNDVRQRWNDACEKHELRLREFMTFSKKMK